MRSLAFAEEHYEKSRARSRIAQGIREGWIVRPSQCERCGQTCKPEAHHENYSKPLEVQWLCKTCHRHIG